MTDLVKRSLQIVSNSAKEISKDYTHNFSSLINDANTIRLNITKAGKNATEVYARIKSGSVTKKISDWFYQKDAEYDQYDSGITEEFDPGLVILRRSGRLQIICSDCLHQIIVIFDIHHGIQHHDCFSWTSFR